MVWDGDGDVLQKSDTKSLWSDRCYRSWDMKGPSGMWGISLMPWLRGHQLERHVFFFFFLLQVSQNADWKRCEETVSRLTAAGTRLCANFFIDWILIRFREERYENKCRGCCGNGSSGEHTKTNVLGEGKEKEEEKKQDIPLMSWCLC